MSDKFPFFAAESGTWRTTSPDPHVDLSGTALTLGTYPVQTFAAAAADTTLAFDSGQTCTVTIWKDATNFKRYEGAVWTDATTDTLDLSAATLAGTSGSIANGDAVSIVASMPAVTPAAIGAEPALGNPGTTGYVLSSTTAGVRSWVAQSSGGGVDTANSPASGEFARFTDADTIEGRTAAEARGDLALEPGVNIQRQLTNVAGAANDNNAAAVNTRITTDISGYSANRTTTLPATFAVDDIVEVFISVGDDTYAQIIAPASGDTIDGGTAGAEWSRLFISGEKVWFRGVVANSAWTVEHDGRKSLLFVATNSAAVSMGNGSFVKYTLNTRDALSNTPPAWFDGATNYRFTPLRKGKWLITAESKYTSMALNKRSFSTVYLNGSLSPIYHFDFAGGDGVGSTNAVNTSGVISLNGSTDYLEMYGRQDSGGTLDGTAASVFTATWLGE